MAAKAWGSQKSAQPTNQGVEEVFFQNEAVSLCLLINRRTKTMRVVDFRAGPSNAKRLFVMSLGQREGAQKVYTLVERDEVSTWVKLGFTKEGNIPGFYKRSDAFVLGAQVPTHRAALRPGARAERAEEVVPMQSEVRIAVSGEAVEAPPPVEEPLDAAHVQMERTLVLAKRHAKELLAAPSSKGAPALPLAKVATVNEAETKKPVATALRTGRALTAFEPFGRDVERQYFVMTAKGGFELYASTEQQQCFGNAFLELLQGPKSEPERLATISSLRALCDKLLASGVVSCFALSPSDDVPLATAFVYNGFRRTGLLQSHMVVGTDRKDAIVWSRKLANPADE
jgi:hypothetical protein